MRSLIVGIVERDLEAEERAYQRRAAAIRAAADYHKRAQLARIMARHELESDEFYTAEQKAQRLIDEGAV